MQPRFRFQSSYMSEIDYMVSDESGTYRIRLRDRAPSSYELSIANGDDVRRDILASIGLLVRAYSVEPLPAETVAAFNSWRAAEHARAMAHFDANPDRYGFIGPDDDLRKPPLVARAARYVTGQGWQAIEEHAQAA